MKSILFLLGFLWVLPVNILAWIFWFLPQYIKGTFEKIKFYPNGIVTWDVKNSSKFFKKLKDDHWWGFVIGSNIVFVDRDSKKDKDIARFIHEETHVYQNYMFGIFFYPVYIAITCFLWLFRPNKHAYLDNPFEKHARKRAGQQVEIPKEKWTRGPNDRWPWW